MNISEIKHTWFSFDFLFVTDLLNYIAVIFRGRRSSIHSEHEKESQNQYVYRKSHKKYKKPTKDIKRFTLKLCQYKHLGPPCSKDLGLSGTKYWWSPGWDIYLWFGSRFGKFHLKIPNF